MSERRDLLNLNSDGNLTSNLNQKEQIPKHKTKVTLIEKTHNNKKKERKKRCKWYNNKS